MIVERVGERSISSRCIDFLMRKLVFRVSNQVRQKPVWAATAKRFKFWVLNLKLSYLGIKFKIKALISLHFSTANLPHCCLYMQKCRFSREETHSYHTLKGIGLQRLSLNSEERGWRVKHFATLFMKIR